MELASSKNEELARDPRVKDVSQAPCKEYEAEAVGKGQRQADWKLLSAFIDGRLRV